MMSVTEHGYLIVIERGDGNFGAWAPDLPGCVAVGDTIEECEAEMREAIAFHIEGLRLEGGPCPCLLRSQQRSSKSRRASALLSRAVAANWQRLLLCQQYLRVCGSFAVERTGIEPVTSGLQSRRSPS